MSFSKSTVRDVPLRNTVVLVRADYNVPLVDGVIHDDLRIRASIPTLRYLQSQGCTIVIISHMGRPEGVSNLEYSLAPVAVRLSELLEQEVQFVDVCYGDGVSQAVAGAQPGDVILLENLRFHAEEEANDAAFAAALARSSQARYFVQDGFGVVHRAHASTEAITHFIPSVAGLLLAREVETITHAMRAPKRPLVAIFGGAKVSDKIQVIEEFIGVADTILIGGAMANTFLAYQGYAMGESKYEPGQEKVLDAIYEAARKKVGENNVDNFLMLPNDVATAKKVDTAGVRVNKDVSELAADDGALDIGDASIERYCKVVDNAATVIWNGPVGVDELPNFAHGSARLALSMASHPAIYSIVGGGDTADFVLGWDGHDGASFTHISTGGGASLDLMAGEKLPGVEALLDVKK